MLNAGDGSAGVARFSMSHVYHHLAKLPLPLCIYAHGMSLKITKHRLYWEAKGLAC